MTVGGPYCTKKCSLDKGNPVFEALHAHKKVCVVDGWTEYARCIACSVDESGSE